MVQSLFFFFHPLSSRTFPPSARKSVQLALLAHNANLMFKLWTIATTPVSFFYPLRMTKKKSSGIPGSTNSPISWFIFFFPSHMYILYVDGTDANFHQNLLTSDAEVQALDTLHRTQKTAVLSTNPVFFDFGGKCERADIFFFFLSLFWKIAWSVNCRGNLRVTLDTTLWASFGSQMQCRRPTFYYKFSCPQMDFTKWRLPQVCCPWLTPLP